MTLRSWVFWTTGFAILLATLPRCLVAGDPATTDNTSELKAENERLLASNTRLAQENADLRARITKMKDALTKAGIDANKDKLSDTTPPASSQPSDESTMAVITSFHTYQDAISAIQNGDGTDIQKRENWLGAVKDLESVLLKNKATVTYAIKDVSFDQHMNLAEIKVKDVLIKSSNPEISDITFREFFHFSIVATEAEAENITKDSRVTLSGTLHVGVIKEPAAEQPAYLFRDGDAPPAGFNLVGWVNGPMSLWREDPCILVKSNSILEINGVKRKMVR